MCGGCERVCFFLAVFVRNVVSILTIFVGKQGMFVHCGLELGMVFRRSYGFIIIYCLKSAVD